MTIMAYHRLSDSTERIQLRSREAANGENDVIHPSRVALLSTSNTSSFIIYIHMNFLNLNSYVCLYDNMPDMLL